MKLLRRCAKPHDGKDSKDADIEAELLDELVVLTQRGMAEVPAMCAHENPGHLSAQDKADSLRVEGTTSSLSGRRKLKIVASRSWPTLPVIWDDSPRDSSRRRSLSLYPAQLSQHTLQANAGKSPSTDSMRLDRLRMLGHLGFHSQPDFFDNDNEMEPSDSGSSLQVFVSGRACG